MPLANVRDWSARIWSPYAWFRWARLAHGCQNAAPQRVRVKNASLRQNGAAADRGRRNKARRLARRASGRIFLEVDGRVIIVADDVQRDGRRPRHVQRPCARGPRGRDAVLRARRTRSTLTVVDRTSAPCLLRGRVAGVSPTRSCFWLQGGQHVLVGRFALPLMGQVIELYGGEVTNAGNYFAGATASMRADGQSGLVPVHMEKLRGADSA